MQVKDQILDRPRADPERDRLVSQLAEITNRLEVIEHEKNEWSLRAANGSDHVRHLITTLDIEAAGLRSTQDVFVRAIDAFDRQRAKYQDAKEAERRERAVRRHKAMLDASETEHRQYIEANIARLRAAGELRDAEIWEHELSRLRQTLEAAMPPSITIGVSPERS